MPRRIHRKRQTEAEINITAFMNLMVVLVPFLLITAVFTHITILELNLPSASAAKTKNKPQFELQIIVRKNMIILADNRGGVIRRLNKTAKGYDYANLTKVLKQIKARFPDKTNASILSEPDTTYDTIVQIMDATRTYRAQDKGEWIDAELFPDISIGDAPK